MAAIIGKKVGMTQVFQEDGTRVPVTVIEAGPDTVTAVRIPDRDGYAAVQLASIEVAERKLTKPELGHLKKAGAPPSTTLIEFRDEAPEAQIGDKLTVEQFEPGQRVKVSAKAIGKGFQGTIKRHNFSRGPGLPRLAQRPRPGLDRRQRRPGPRLQGREDAGPDGRQARHPARPRGRSRSTPSATCCCSAARSRAQGRHGGGAHRWLALEGDRRWASRRRPTCPPASSARSSTRASSTRPRARTSHARRRGTASTLGRGEVSMTTAKAWSQKGTGRARAGALSVPHRRGGGVAFGPKPRSHTFKVNRKARRRALRSALSVHAARDSIAVVDAAAYEDALDQAGRRGAREVGREGRRRWSSATPRRPASSRAFATSRASTCSRSAPPASST